MAGWALAGYTGVTSILAGPLLWHLSDRLIGPGGGDNQWWVWCLWHFRRSVESGLDPAHSNQIFALLPSVQVLLNAFFDTLMAWPLQWLVSPVAAYNLLLLLSFPAAGLATYLLVGEVGASPLARFTAGFFYTFSTYHFARSAGHLGLVTIQFMPLFAWSMLVLFRAPSFRNSLYAGLSLALVPLSDIYYGAYFALPFGILWVGYQLVIAPWWFRRGRNLALLALVCLVAVLVSAPLLLTYLHLDPDITQAIASERASTEALSADVFSLVLPAAANPIFGRAVAPLYKHMTSPWEVETSVFLGHAALALATVALFGDRDRLKTRFWAIVSGMALLLAFGPCLHIAGRPIMHLPFYSLVFRWPLDGFRAPNRLTVLALLAICVLAARGLDVVCKRVPRRLIAPATMMLLAGALAENVLWGLRLPSVQVGASALLQQLAARPDDGLLLDLPAVPRGDYPFQQLFHGKRIVCGYGHRVSTPMWNSIQVFPLADLSSGSVPELGSSHTEAFLTPLNVREALQGLGIRYVILHPMETNQVEVRAFLEQSLGAPLYDDRVELITAWAVPRFKPCGSGPRLRLGDGWLPGVHDRDGVPERIVEQDGEFAIEVSEAFRGRLQFHAVAYLRPMTIEVSIDGVVAKRIRIDHPWEPVPVDVGIMTLNPGEHLARFHVVEGCARPVDIDPNNPDTRCFGIGIQQLKLAPL